MGRTVRDITGETFGRLLAVELASKPWKYGAEWICWCDCGRETQVPSHSLVHGLTRSCGCLARSQKFGNSFATIHGEAATVTPTYQSWMAMKKRCLDPAFVGYKYYGGRGITICSRWLTYTNFRADMGERPEHLTLDRIDNDGNYEPGNCRWATWSEQTLNQRRNEHSPET